MTLKHICAALAVAAALQTVGDVAYAQSRGGMGGGFRSGGLSPRSMGVLPRASGLAPSSSPMTTMPITGLPTSGALPRLPSSGALPTLPTSGAVPSVTPSIAPNLGGSALIGPQQPVQTARRGMGAPYQAPCGTYPLPQC